MGTPPAPPFLVVRDVRKAFGGAQALKSATLGIAPGEVHGLAGANGAGKSTLIKILAGLHRPDSGSIELDGRTVEIVSPHVANTLGMSFIHQELAAVPGMTVLQNIMLGIPKPSRFGLTNWTEVRQAIHPLVRKVGLTAPLNAPVKELSTAEKWLINICRALVQKSRLIVMDEPTASLSSRDSDRLLEIIRGLSQSGVAVLYVSHRLDELLMICDNVTVFRDGNSVAEFNRQNLTRAALVEAIVGKDIVPQRRGIARTLDAETVLDVHELSRFPRVRGVSFKLRRGEVLGIGGLVGAGRSELARLIYGADRADGGRMLLDGEPFSPRTPVDAVARGLGFVPEERRTEGLVLSKSVAFNLSLANLDSIVFGRFLPLLNRRRQNSLAQDVITALSVKTQSALTPVGQLSGGNQQKVVIGRWLQKPPRVLILDEPTRGVDIGARDEIHKLIRRLAEKGMAVLVISSEPDELPDLCDRVLVMAEGQIVRELTGADLSRAAIVEASYDKLEAIIEGIAT